MLPRKFRGFVEGLTGNFNGNPEDDLINRDNNPSSNAYIMSNGTLINDTSIRLACLSCMLNERE